MSEKYILMGRGIPSIIRQDQPIPGVRLTPSEARDYARELFALAEELEPADLPAPAKDALDAMRRERDKLLIIVKPLRELWKRYITDDSLEDYVTQDMFLDWLEKGTNLDDVFRALKTAIEIKESDDDHE